MNPILCNYFQFLKMCEETTEKWISFDSGIPLMRVQQAVNFRFRIKNFPAFKINLESTSLMQSMIDRKTGFIIQLSNLIVVSIIHEGSLSKKKFYKPACECIEGESKCSYFSVLDCVNTNDDLAKTPFNYIPKCKVCNTSYAFDGPSEMFAGYTIATVRSISRKNETYTVYAERQEKGKIEVGRLMEGIFFLKSISRLNPRFEQRFEGDYTTVLLAIQLEEDPTVEVLAGKNDSSILEKIRQKKNFQRYASIQKGLEDEERISEELRVSSSNFLKIFSNLPPEFPCGILFDISFLLLCVWHAHTIRGDRNKSITRHTISNPQSADQPTQSYSEIMDSSSCETKMNMLVLDKRQTASNYIYSRMAVLAASTVNIEFLPSLLDEDTCKQWLVVNAHSVVVILNFNMYISKVRQVLMNAIDRHTVVDDDVTVQLYSSFIVVVCSLDSLHDRKQPDFKSVSSSDCFDICIDLDKPGEIGQQFDGEIDSIIELYTSGKNSGINYWSDSSMARSKSDAFNHSSQNSRISMMCNKICQKMMIKPTEERLEDRSQEFSLARNLLLSFSSSLKVDYRVSQKNLLSLKIISLSSRILRCYCVDEQKALESIIKNELTGKFEIEIFDALFSILLFDNTRATLSPFYQSELFSSISNCQSSSSSNPYLNTILTSITNPLLATHRETINVKASDRQQFSNFEGLMEEVKKYMFSLVKYYL